LSPVGMEWSVQMSMPHFVQCDDFVEIFSPFP